MREIRICKRCVMDETDDTIVFDENGYCNYCRDALKRKEYEYHPTEKGKLELEKKIEEIKEVCKNLDYDCMIGVSGGLDSSYVLYLSYKYGLRPLAVHIDDGLDTEIAKKNINNLCNKTQTKLIRVTPDPKEYADLLKSFFLASVPNIAMIQDSILFAALNQIIKDNKIKYNLSGLNFAMESILQRSKTGVNFNDVKNIKAIHRQFGTCKLKNTKFSNLYEAYIGMRYFNKVEKVLPLNYIDYNMQKVLKELSKFCDFDYYGGKHHESVLTRFLQNYYLPVKFGYDKRKSHFSSLIVSGQMTRDQAMEKLKEDHYFSEDLKQNDFHVLADFLGMSEAEFKEMINLPPKCHKDYPYSRINDLAPMARKFRKFLG